jgi:hypothetical protein
MNDLESILRAAYHRAVSGSAGRPHVNRPDVNRPDVNRPDVNRLSIASLTFDPAAGPAGGLIGDADGRGWTGFTPDRRRRLRLDDLRFR